ncbi:MAG: hypothetical protein OSB63_00145 [Planctomycetota bacterium]|nr:hypothetical protein [Planctomycetota bacterium]
MKFLIIALLALASCAGEPQQVETPIAPQSQDPAEMVTIRPSEKAAIEAEQEFINEMASEGIYPETTPTQITVKYHRSGLTIGLYNESYISQTDYYQQERSSAVYKVIPDMKMGALLKALTDGDFFEDATDGIKRYTGASVSIIIRNGSKSYSLAWGPSVNEDLYKVTNVSADSIRVMYDTTRSIQVIGNTSGGDFFQEESDRINKENALQRVKPRRQ